jgi:quinol monooxygenase YgiN
MSVVIVATIVPIEGHREELIVFLEEVIAQAHAKDEGCELYALHEADDRLVFIEKWADGDALKAHSKGAALRQVAEGLKGKTTGATDVVVLRPHPAGAPEQGTL